MTGRRRKPGRMGPFIEGYRDWLASRGYTSATVINMLAMASVLGRWLDSHDLAPADLDRAAISEFRGAMRAGGRRYVPGARGLDPLLDYLKHVGVLDVSAVPTTLVETLVERYRAWLVADRGLADATVERYVKLARTFLSRCGREVESLTGGDIVAFLLAEAQRLSVGSVQGRVAELRSLLKFLYLQGLTPRSLATVVPPVAGWRDTGVPKAIRTEDAHRLLASCDRGDPIGIRDYAILMLVTRLGLRSAEVAHLEFDDI
ncbi:MAG: integrase, partial [Actinophytocola sp.]|nr:integrase [Actinophytocola sp.]